MPSNSYKPESYYFAEAGSLTQSSGQAFGVADGSNFRLTTKFTVGGSGSKAFAICKGIVLVQPQTGSADKVNVILRPFSQPIEGFNIKYFIYRGLKKDGFFNGNNVLSPGSTASDFIGKINASFTAFHNNLFPEAPLPAFLAKYIGFDPVKQQAFLPLSDLFFKESVYVESEGGFEDEEKDYELPVIEAGKSLGAFATGECGIDVVLSYGDYKLPQAELTTEFAFNLAYARAAEATITLATQEDAYQKKIKKEQISQFLDIAAYYGFHASTEGSVKVNNAGTIEIKKGQAIYDSLLQPFQTKNTLYLYIQGDRTRSYNFYGNYLADAEDSATGSLKTGPTFESMTVKAYDTQGWPLLTDTAAQNHNNDRNKLYLQLVTDNNLNTALYGQIGQIDNGKANNFCDADFLLLPASSEGELSAWTNVIELSNPATGPAGSKLNIGTFNILLYQGIGYSYVAGQTTDDQNTPTDVLATPNFFDDVFDLITASPLFQTGAASTYSSLTSQKLKLINHYYDRQQKGISAVQTVIVSDSIETGETDPAELSRVTYITEAANVLTAALSVSGTITADTKTSPSAAGRVSKDMEYRLPAPFYYTINVFTDSTETISGLELKASDGSLPNKIVLGLSKEENEQLKTLITANNLRNARLFLVDLFEDGNQLISSEGIRYQKYRAGMVGELPTDGTLKLFMPQADIIVYSTDRLYHYSKNYSQFMKEIENVFVEIDSDY